MKHWIKVLGALSMLAMGACNPIVLDPLHPESSESGLGSDPGEAPSEPSEEPSEPSAIAMRFAQFNPPTFDPSSLFEFGVTSSDPDALLIFFGSRGQSCADPVIQLASPGATPAVCAGQAFWQAAFIIPSALAQPGIVDLSSPDVSWYQATWKAACGGGSGHGPGMTGMGTLEIVSIDASTVEVKLNLLQPSSFGTQNGDYTATICP